MVRHILSLSKVSILILLMRKHIIANNFNPWCPNSTRTQIKQDPIPLYFCITMAPGCARDPAMSALCIVRYVNASQPNEPLTLLSASIDSLILTTGARYHTQAVSLNIFRLRVLSHSSSSSTDQLLVKFQRVILCHKTQLILAYLHVSGEVCCSHSSATLNLESAPSPSEDPNPISCPQRLIRQHPKSHISYENQLLRIDFWQGNKLLNGRICHP